MLSYLSGTIQHSPGLERERLYPGLDRESNDQCHDSDAFQGPCAISRMVAQPCDSVRHESHCQQVLQQSFLSGERSGR